jgi:hypothetical protein
VCTLWAQPGSITTKPIATTPPVAGPAVFDAAGNIYFFKFGPVTAGAAQTQNGGGTCLPGTGLGVPGPCPDAYIDKVDSAGSLMFGTYLGAQPRINRPQLAVDAAGNVIVTGLTGGSFPTTANAAITASRTAKAFAAKLSANGSRVLYATYLPDAAAAASAIAVDPQGNAYIAGASSSRPCFHREAQFRWRGFPVLRISGRYGSGRRYDLHVCRWQCSCRGPLDLAGLSRFAGCGARTDPRNGMYS